MLVRNFTSYNSMCFSNPRASDKLLVASEIFLSSRTVCMTQFRVGLLEEQ